MDMFMLEYIVVLQGVLGLIACERWRHHKSEARKARAMWSNAMLKLRLRK